MTSDDNLDPELAELMALEEAERAESTGIAPGQPHRPDPELVAQMQQEAAIRFGFTGPPSEFDPELAELLALEKEERRRQQG
ncbi:MAG TPA: hypothetical protein VFQ44_30790 [Streptosporangiaceae bacterium]|nr:hypothetical protein [Streptosporangiaceae bacterium]